MTQSIFHDVPRLPTPSMPTTDITDVKDWDGPESLQIQFRWQGTILDVGHFDRPQIVTVGPHPLNDFSLSIEVLGDLNFPLIVPEGPHGYSLFFTEQFTGHFIDGEETSYHLDKLCNSLERTTRQGQDGFLLPLASGERVQLQTGELEVEICFVRAEQPEVVPYQQNREYLWWRLLSASAIIHCCVILAFQFVPSGADALQQSSLLGKFSMLLPGPIQPPPKQRPRFELKKKKPKPQQPKTRTSHRSKTQATHHSNRRTFRKVSDVGVLGALNAAGLKSKNIFGRMDSQQWLGKVLGTTGASPLGMTGRFAVCFGSDCSDGSGGGGGYDGLAGVWKGTKRSPHYTRYTRSSRGLKWKKKVVRISAGSTRITGSLTKAEIGRVVHAQWYLIKYCYEKQLRKTPTLSGKVSLRWVIAGTGYVEEVKVTHSTMNNDAVENCLIRRVRRFKFPQPRGGGIVVVNYPFLFNQVR